MAGYCCELVLFQVYHMLVCALYYEESLGRRRCGNLQSTPHFAKSAASTSSYSKLAGYPAQVSVPAAIARSVNFLFGNIQL